MSKTLAEQIEAIALGVERGDSLPAPAGRRLREIAAKARKLECDLEQVANNYRQVFTRINAAACRIAALETQLRPARDGHPIPPYGYVPDETQAPYIAGPDTGPFGESLDD